MTESVPKLSKYEKARMIGARALQISMGAPFLVKIDEKKMEEIRYNPIEIAKMEYEEGIIPLEIIRRKPEFFEDLSKHPLAGKAEGEVVEEIALEDIKLEEEDIEEVAGESTESDETPE
jgi:DNA-directed RNA polymerase subunit K/omega